MRIDFYTRGVLTIIAVALIYLCILFTPLPTVSAQRGLRPGDDTGPAQVVVVGWRTTDQPPVQVQVMDSVPLRVSGAVSVNGLVETRSTANSVERVVLTGWEESAPQPIGQATPGTFRPLNSRAQGPTLRGMPVTAYPPQ